MHSPRMAGRVRLGWARLRLGFSLRVTSLGTSFEGGVSYLTIAARLSRWPRR